MTSRYPIEALLRPPVEFISVVVASSAAWLAWSAPSLWMTTAPVARGAALALLCLAAVRGRQGLCVVRFQRNLRRLPEYRLKPSQIPVSAIRLFLGTGFRWTQLHTQRLADTRQPEARRYVDPGRGYRWARRMETVCEHHRALKPLATLLATRAWWNPLAPLPPVGGDPALHGVEPEEGPVTMPLADRVGHILVLGTTRVGKTRLGEVLITQDIHREEVVIVFDPKGDPELAKRVFTEARRAGRERDLTFFHLGFPEVSARYNAVGGVRAHHRGRDPHREPASLRRKQRRLPRVRLAVCEHHRPRLGGVGTPARLPPDPRAHHRHRAPLRGVRTGLSAPSRAQRVGGCGRGASTR